jgi:hypothetical protein
MPLGFVKPGFFPSVHADHQLLRLMQKVIQLLEGRAHSSGRWFLFQKRLDRMHSTIETGDALVCEPNLAQLLPFALVEASKCATLVVFGHASPDAPPLEGAPAATSGAAEFSPFSTRA